MDSARSRKLWRCARASLPCRGCAVQHISPGVRDALTIKDGLVEVETVQVDHGADAQGGEPDAGDRPGSQEEVKAAVVEGRIGRSGDRSNRRQPRCCRSLPLGRTCSRVLGLALGGFTHQGGGHQGAVHGGERGSPNTCDAQHVEGVHQDVVLSWNTNMKLKVQRCQGSVREGT